MRRDMDLIRALLLKIEAEGEPELRDVPELEGFPAEQVVHHVTLLIQAGLLTAIDASTMQEVDYLNLALTWQGARVSRDSPRP